MNVRGMVLAALAIGWVPLAGLGQGSGAGPTFRVADSELGQKVTVIAYGDMRFHQGADARVGNAAARRALVAKIAAEQPDALQLSGDVPYQGGNIKDYDVYRAETGAWREARRGAGLRVYPALGNHEMNGAPEGEALEHWWGAFPELKGRRWYSVALGRRIYMLQLDSTSDLTPGSPQRAWLEAQVAGLDKGVDFVLIGLHHPPVADVQTRMLVDHNPRANEISLRDYLTGVAATSHARFVVEAGHIHNYERAKVGEVVYLVSGGGGAKPYEVERTAPDLYQDKEFPNFHYVKFELEKKELKATMYRLKDADAAVPEFEVKDQFEVKEK